jgi:stearoyl-CoA desaturase (delta-9 desaturase)
MCDIDTLRAVVANRYEVMANFSKLLKQIYHEEVSHLKQRLPDFGKVDLKRYENSMYADESALNEQEKLKLCIFIRTSQKLNAAYNLRKDLIAIWQRSTATREQMVIDLEDRCHRAESSGIEAMQHFSRRLRCYA